MQRFRNFVSVLALAVASISSAPPCAAQQPVVVELFTSEGCASCPPADALLTTLSKQRTATSGVELILLGEHVEYWNNLGWRDRFSAPAYTQRQYDYVRHLHLATAYTPQIVVDGHLQAVGNNASAVQHMIAESARTPKPASVSLRFVSPSELQVAVTDPSNGKQHVLLAITEDKLSTTVQAGENGGRVLTHAAVVRELNAVGVVSNGRFDKTVVLIDKRDWKKEDLRVVVLVQDAGSGEIRGAASIPFQPASPARNGR